jgi:hypothetical protein
MSSLLSQVIKGKVEAPFLVLVYGPHGIGKSTFGASAPNPIFVGPEQGTNNLDVARFPTPKSFAEITQALNELATETHPYKTVVIDSLDWLEVLVHQKVMHDHKVKSIELAAGGYGKGYTEAKHIFGGLIEQLSVLRNKKRMNVVLIAHSQITKFEDPQSQTAYDRFSIKLHKASAALFQEYVDAILFCTHKKYTSKEGDTTRTFTDGTRIMLTSWNAGQDAKNRYGLPEEIALSWDDFTASAREESASDVRKRIESMIPQVPADVVEKVNETLSKAGENIAQLKAIETRLNILISNKEQAK